MRFINLIVIHCSATRSDRCYTEHDLTTDHLAPGFLRRRLPFLYPQERRYKEFASGGTSRRSCQGL